MKIMCPLMAAAFCMGPAEAVRAPAEAGHYARQSQAAQQNRPFVVGTASAARGQKAYGVIHVPSGSDAGYDIPVAVIHGTAPGPVLAVVSGAHGTEYASILAVEELIATVDATRMSGTLILVPIVNINSFDKITPHVNPTDNKSMNRFYPGTLSGTQTDRASFVITKEVIDQCDHLIDLHGGDLDENLRPYSYWTVTGNKAQDEISKAMVVAFGLDHIIIAADRPKDPAASRYLENTASVRGKPSFAAEAGRSGPPAAGDVKVLADGVRRVMAHLKMTSARFPAPPKTTWVETITVTAERDGVFWPAVDRDANVAKGAKLGTVTDYWHRPLQDITSPDAGIVMFVRALPTLHKGDTVASIGVMREPR